LPEGSRLWLPERIEGLGDTPLSAKTGVNVPVMPGEGAPSEMKSRFSWARLLAFGAGGEADRVMRQGLLEWIERPPCAAFAAGCPDRNACRQGISM